ncbi:hypothetical protein E4T42_07020 [Aureobasidium subglaciale]|nr:hypothetical protein E4T42_07020 [Aureobasidium subglaciale]
MKPRTRAGNGGAFRLAPEPPPTRPLVKKNKTVAKRRSSQANVQSTKTTIFQHKRPVWPAKGLTADESQTTINTLEHGDDDQKLMALFARHVIMPGTRHRGSQWVSRRSLYKAFPEHIEKTGFTAKSSWKQKRAIDFGLPELFLRGVDDHRAILTPHDNVHDVFEDSGRPPALQALTDDEYQWLEQRSKPCQHGSHPHTHTPSSTKRLASAVDQNDIPAHPAQDGYSVQMEDDRDEAMTSISKRLRSAREPSNRVPSISDKEPIMIVDSEEDPSFETGSQRSTLEMKAELPSTTSSYSDGSSRFSGQHVLQRPSAKARASSIPRIVEESRKDQYKLDQADKATNPDQQTPVQMTSEPATVDMPAPSSGLVSRICEILRDFPNAYEDPNFIPLLRKVGNATAADEPEGAEEEAYLNLQTYIIAESPIVPLAEEVKLADLVKPILKAMAKYRRRLTTKRYSQNQKDIKAMCLAKDLNGLRATHAKLLIFEAKLQDG